MNPFQKNEIKGRQLLAELLNQFSVNDIQFTKDRFNPVDGFFTNNNKKAVFEIKVRDLKYLSYNTLIIEEQKYQNLLNIKDANNCSSGLYFNFIGDYCYVFTLKVIGKSQLKELYCNSCTADGKGKKKYKTVRYLDKAAARVFHKENDVWYLKK